MGCNPSPSNPGVYAKITREVKTWIKSVASGTQDSDCDTETPCEDCDAEQLSNKEKEERKEKNTENDQVKVIEPFDCYFPYGCW